MPSKAKRLTIKQFAHDYFRRVSFVDIYGRNIGYDYTFILDEIKKQFPGARTSRRWLQDMAYILNRTERLPVRRRSRRTLAEDYAMSLLLRRSGVGVHKQVAYLTRKKFPEQSISADQVRRLDKWLNNKNFKLPPRPE